jgi:hypothetical protein
MVCCLFPPKVTLGFTILQPAIGYWVAYYVVLGTVVAAAALGGAWSYGRRKRKRWSIHRAFLVLFQATCHCSRVSC